MANTPREPASRRRPRGRTPPYVSFGQFKSLLRRLQQHGLPARLDSSIISHTSTSTQIQTLLAFRFLELVDPQGQPTGELAGLVKALGGDPWASTLRPVLQHAYAPIFNLALKTITPEQFEIEFDRNYYGTNNVLRKSRTFFLHGAREAGIELSPYLLATIKLRGEPMHRATRPRPRHPQRSSTPRHDSRQASEPLPAAAPMASQHAAPLSDRLVSELDLRQMTGMQQRAFWTMLKFLKELGR